MTDETKLEEVPPVPAIPHVVVSLLDGQVDVTHDNISVLAVPTLLRIAAKTVEAKFEL